MKKVIFTTLMIAFLLIGTTGSVFAKGPAEFTIDVRNRTGTPVQFNYRGADGIDHWATIPVGVSSLTLAQGVYAYWADPKCGHIAGRVNVDTQNKTLLIGCESAHPLVVATFIRNDPCADWGIFLFSTQFFSYTNWTGTQENWDDYADLFYFNGGIWGCYSDFDGITDYFTEL